MVEAEVLGHVHLLTIPLPQDAGLKPEVSRLCTLQQLFERGRKRNIQFPVQIRVPHQNWSSIVHIPHLPQEAALSFVENPKHTRFHDSFHAVDDYIDEGLYYS